MKRTPIHMANVNGPWTRLIDWIANCWKTGANALVGNRPGSVNSIVAFAPACA